MITGDFSAGEIIAAYLAYLVDTPLGMTDKVYMPDVRAAVFTGAGKLA